MASKPHSPKKAPKQATPRTKAPKRAKTRKPPPRLLAGGNPQIAKADGDAPVQAYIAAMPGWQSSVGRRLDELIVKAVPRVKKAVKWNSPLYGIDGKSFFLGIHTFSRYVKVAFFRGAALVPPPPRAAKQGETRYLDIHADDELDAAEFTKWVKQAAKLPGWVP